MVATKYFAATESLETSLASELAGALSKKHNGTVESVWLDNKAGS